MPRDVGGGGAAGGRELLGFIIDGGEDVEEGEGGYATAVEVGAAEFGEGVYGRLGNLLNVVDVGLVRMIHDDIIPWEMPACADPYDALTPSTFCTCGSACSCVTKSSQ